MTRMDDPAGWPLGDILPLVRRTPGGSLWPETGLLLAKGGPVVYLACAFEPGLQRRLATCERITYLTFKDVESDNWRVD